MTDSNGNKLSVQGTDNMFQQLDDLIPKNRNDRSKIVEAGVPVAEKQLTNYTPERVHLYPSQNKLGSKTRNPLHIKEAVTHLPNEYVDGSTDVGFNSQAAPIARWVDQGTYRQDPQFFIEHAFEGLDTDALFGAEERVYKQMLISKGLPINE